METVKKVKRPVCRTGRKAGRPVAIIKKEVRAAVRFSKTEYFIIQAKAQNAGVTTSEYIRQIAINGQVKIRASEEDRQVARQLIGMANNLNQLAKTCHQEGLLTAMMQFEYYRSGIDSLLQKLKP